MLLYNVLKKNRGFTLVEMIAVAVIVGIVAALAAPSLLGVLNQTRVKEGVGQVESAIREAQKQARRRGRTCKIKFVTRTIDGKSRQVVSVVEDTDPDETVAADFYNGCLLSERFLPVDVSINSGSISKITFTGKGNTIADSQGIIIVSHTTVDTKKCVQISGSLGNIITGDYDASSTPPSCATP